jgi:hypothetical protein
VLRAKDRLRDLDGSRRFLQIVGARCEVADADGADGASALVCMGPADSLDRSSVETAIGAAASR